MMTIRTLISYAPKKSKPATRPARKKLTPEERATYQYNYMKHRRAKWKEDGKCTQCGGERPCSNHTKQVDDWRKRTGKR